jgi:rfaE bifunctional protein kinase chain/domain
LSIFSLTDCLSSTRLSELLACFPALKIGVIGDMGLDVYWYADMTRSHLSRETPHFPRPVVRESYGPGAGANVAQNLKALGVGQVRVYSLIGQDPWGIQLRAELVRRGIETSALLASAGRRTTAYVKPLLLGYNSQQEDARLDFENSRPPEAVDEQRLLQGLENDLAGLDALVVADQLEDYGVVTGQVRERLNLLAIRGSRPLFLADSRVRIGLYRGMVIKPNELEASAAFAAGSSPEADLSRIGRAISRTTGRPAFITLGERGALACQEDHAELIPAAPVRPPLDVVGAGDTFMAALAAGLAAGAAPREAAALANLAAAVSVEKLNQTGTACPEEILERYTR